MKSQKEWFSEYAESHQNSTNQKIHFFCVPIIYFSIVGLLMAIPLPTAFDLSVSLPSILMNWATPVIVVVLLFYIRLSFKTFLGMFLFSLFSIWVNAMISGYLPLALVSISLFVIAWIGQFYGHKIEGKKPSFLTDIQFLLIGPAWVFEKLSR